MVAKLAGKRTREGSRSNDEMIGQDDTVIGRDACNGPAADETLRLAPPDATALFDGEAGEPLDQLAGIGALPCSGRYTPAL